LAELPDDVLRKTLVPLPFRDSRRDLVLGEIPDGLSDPLLILGEVEVHGVGGDCPPPPAPRPRRRRRNRRRRPSARPGSAERAACGGGDVATAGCAGRGVFGAGGGGAARGRPPDFSPPAKPRASPRPRRPRRRSRRGSGVSIHPSSRCRKVTTISGRPPCDLRC